MVDIETLGTAPGSVILSIGACYFNEDGIGERFYRPVDVFSSLMAGLTVDQATVGFWRLQSEEAKGALRPAVSLLEALGAFTEFITRPPAPMLWAKGPDFDLVLLAAAYEALGSKKPWHYRVARDVRTILALAPGTVIVLSTHPKHHALGDAEDQALQVIEAAHDLGFPLSEMV